MESTSRHSVPSKKRFVPIPVSKSDLREIKALKNPPVYVKKVGKAFMITMGESKNNWAAVCGYLINSTTVYSKIVNFPRNGLTDLQKIKLKDMIDDFDFSKIQGVSLPVSNLALWLQLVYNGANLKELGV